MPRVDPYDIQDLPIVGTVAQLKRKGQLGWVDPRLDDRPVRSMGPYLWYPVMHQGLPGLLEVRYDAYAAVQNAPPRAPVGAGAGPSYTGPMGPATAAPAAANPTAAAVPANQAAGVSQTAQIGRRRSPFG